MAKWNVTREGETNPTEVEADGYQFLGNGIAFYNAANPAMFQQPILVIAFNDWIMMEPVVV